MMNNNLSTLNKKKIQKSHYIKMSSGLPGA